MNELRLKRFLMLLMLALLMALGVGAVSAQEPHNNVNSAQVRGENDARAHEELNDDRLPTAIVVQSAATDNSVFDWVILAQTVLIGALLTILLYTTPVLEYATRRLSRRKLPADNPNKAEINS